MSTLLNLITCLLALSLLLGMVRVFIGPSMEDRMLSVQLVGTSGVGLVLLLGFSLELPAAIDVALILALLAAISVVALTRRQLSEEAVHD